MARMLILWGICQKEYSKSKRISCSVRSNLVCYSSTNIIRYTETISFPVPPLQHTFRRSPFFLWPKRTKKPLSAADSRKAIFLSYKPVRALSQDCFATWHSSANSERTDVLLCAQAYAADKNCL